MPPTKKKFFEGEMENAADEHGNYGRIRDMGQVRHAAFGRLDSAVRRGPSFRKEAETAASTDDLHVIGERLIIVMQADMDRIRAPGFEEQTAVEILAPTGMDVKTFLPRSIEDGRKSREERQ